MNLLGFLCPCCGWNPLAVTLEVHLVQSSASRCHSSWHLNVPETDPCLQGILMGKKSETICFIYAEQIIIWTVHKLFSMGVIFCGCLDPRLWGL